MADKTGEFDWIENIRRRFAPLVPPGVTGIGDDGAVIPLGGGESLVVTADLLVEGVHFIKEHISPEDLGGKSLAVNLSDVAAMGAAPVASFLSIGLPAESDAPWRERFLAGYEALSAEFDVPLLGGDTTAADKITINVTALGRVPNGRVKRRSAAVPGDIVCVTGSLGDSAAGLRLQGRPAENDDERALILAHHRPRPAVAEGLWLGGRAAVHAMMDVSDGIASDLRHIAEASGASARVELDRLPLSGALRRVATTRGWDSVELAATGGEDYVLLLTVQADAFDELNRDYKLAFGTALTSIGRIAPGAPILEWLRDGTAQPLDWKGFEHF